MLEDDPEADLHQVIAKYDSKRLEKLRGTQLYDESKIEAESWQGTSTDVYTTLKAKEDAKHTTSTERCIPEPHGDFVVALPLSSQVRDLIGLNSSDSSNTPTDTIWRLLRDGTILHKLFSQMGDKNHSCDRGQVYSKLGHHRDPDYELYLVSLPSMPPCQPLYRERWKLEDIYIEPESVLIHLGSNRIRLSCCGHAQPRPPASIMVSQLAIIYETMTFLSNHGLL